MKSYQVVYDKRIIIGKGEDTIPFGYYWPPGTISYTEPALPTMQSVPDHILFTMVHPTAPTTVEHMQIDGTEDDVEMMDIEIYSEDIADDVNLMDTDNETDNDYEQENESDRDFINDFEMYSDENDASFYRQSLF